MANAHIKVQNIVIKNFFKKFFQLPFTIFTKTLQAILRTYVLISAFVFNSVRYSIREKSKLITENKNGLK